MNVTLVVVYILILLLLILSGFIILLLKIFPLEKQNAKNVEVIKQRFSTRDDFAPEGYLAMSADIFGFSGLGREVGATGIYCGEARGAAKLPRCIGNAPPRKAKQNKTKKQQRFTQPTVNSSRWRNSGIR